MTTNTAETAPNLPHAAAQETFSVCPVCLARFVPTRPNQRFCRPEEKVIWEGLVREVGKPSAERMFKHYREITMMRQPC